MLNLSVLFLMLCFVFPERGKVFGGSEAEMRDLLFAKLNSTDYSPRVRPIKDTGNTLNLTVDMYLVAINKVDEVEQQITTTAYLKIVWYDTFMTWEPADYGNITEFAIPQDEIWKPDIALANAFYSITGLGDKFMYVKVTNDGRITWEPFQRFVSTCSLRMQYFPFDSHVCDIQMATWSSTKEMIRIIPGTDGFNIDSFEENANWNLLSVSTFDSSTVSTSGLSFSMTIRRKPIYYILNTIIPVILLSVLNSFVFVLPCSCGEKLTFAIILFLSFTIFLLIVTEVMPEGMSTVPIVTIYLLLEIIFSTLIVLIAAVQLRLHNREDKSPLPKIFKDFTEAIQKVKRLICFDYNKPADDDINRDEVPMETFVPPVKMKFRETNEMAEIEDNEEPSEKSKSAVCTSLFKRRLICGAGKVENTEREMMENTWDIRYGRMSDKTAFKLADVLGKSNRVEPEAYFNKPTEIGPLYDQKLAVEDLDDTETAEYNLHVRLPNKETMRRVPLFSSSVSSSETSSINSESQEKSEIAWSDFVLALDNTLFVASILINTISTVVTFFVSMTN